jgi:hypothetical protein
MSQNRVTLTRLFSLFRSTRAIPRDHIERCASFVGGSCVSPWRPYLQCLVRLAISYLNCTYIPFGIESALLSAFHLPIPTEKEALDVVSLVPVLQIAEAKSAGAWLSQVPFRLPTLKITTLVRIVCILPMVICYSMTKTILRVCVVVDVFNCGCV